MTDYMDLSASAMVRLVEGYMTWPDPTPGNSAWALESLNAGYRRVLRGFSPASRRAHTWTHLLPVATLTIPASQSTTTATGTYAAGTGLTTVTAAVAKFYPHIVGRTINLSTEGDMVVYGYTSATVVTVSGDHSWAGNETLTVPDNGAVDLPEDFGGLDRPFEYLQTPDSSVDLPRLQAAPHDQIMAIYRDNPQPADPEFYAIVAQPLTAATGQRWEVWFAPTPIADRSVSYRYRVKAVALTDDTEVYPIGGTDLCDVIVQAAKADAERRSNQGGRAMPEEAAFVAMMEEAVLSDLARNEDDVDSIQLLDRDTGISV
jgi:hypothetical protein